LEEIAKFAIKIEEEMHGRRKKMTKYQLELDNGEFNDDEK
jgi:hypothetical protein